VTIDVKVDGVPRRFGYAVDAILAQPPVATALVATRTADSVTFSWNAAGSRDARKVARQPSDTARRLVDRLKATTPTDRMPG